MIANNNIYLKIPQISSVLYICTHWPTCQKFVHHQVSLWHSRDVSSSVLEDLAQFLGSHRHQQKSASTRPHPSTITFPKALGQGQRDLEFPIFPIPDCQISSRKLSFIPGLVTGETTILFREKPLKPLTQEKFCSLSPQKMRENSFTSILACLPQSDPFFLIQDFQSDRCPINIKGST